MVIGVYVCTKIAAHSLFSNTVQEISADIFFFSPTIPPSLTLPTADLFAAYLSGGICG